MAAETDKVEPADSEQDEEEDVYEVERIIDMRVEEGEVLYRVRWKNYCSDDDTWEPEAHLEDCREVLLAFKKSLADAKAKKLPTKSDVFDADSESDSDKDPPAEAPIKKKKKKKIREEEDEPPPKDKKKKKKEKRKDDVRPVPAPETDEEEEEERAPTPPSSPKEKKTESKKRLVDSDEDDDEPVPSKKHKKEKGKEGAKHKKEKGEDGKKRKGKKERKIETSEDEATAPLEDYLSDGPSESQMDDTTSSDTVTKSAEKARVESKQKKGKWEVKLQGIKDLIQDKKSKKPDAAQKESSLQKLKNLTSKSKEENAPHSDSSDSSTLHKKAKSKGQECASAPPKGPSSSASSSSSSSVTAASSVKVKEEEMVVKEEVLGQKDTTGSTNLFEKFLLNCEAKDRAPRRQPVHQPPVEKTNSKPAKGEEGTTKLKIGEDSRERREKPEEAQRPSWERRTPTDDRRKRRDDSEPRLFMACDDNQDAQDPPEGADKSKGQATLSLGMDLNLDWMTLDDFQKHLNGEDEILSGPPLSPELRDAVKSGDYMAVKLALNSKEDYNLDQEDVSGMSLSMLAAAGGQDDILRLLIKKGVRVNGRQKNGTTALMHAAEKQNFLTTVAILLEAGSYLNAQTLSGETALMKACKRGNADVVRLLLEYGADCNILSKHKHTAMYFAKLSNNLVVCDLIRDHISRLSSVAEDTIRAYFESRLVLLEPVFPLACHRLCEGPDFSMEFAFKSQPQPESGILLFIFHANFLSEITARLCGPCSVHAVVLNDKFQLPIFLDSHFIYSFSPIPGINRLFIRLAEAPTAKVKLLICAYRVQLQ
uniref:M-phase phosphoprotein 8 n=1 Tax=Seriola lalandi dorsalis TaxID=1841481 RepID=A0A3B4Y295_SERLL